METSHSRQRTRGPRGTRRTRGSPESWGERSGGGRKGSVTAHLSEGAVGPRRGEKSRHARTCGAGERVPRRRARGEIRSRTRASSRETRDDTFRAVIARTHLADVAQGLGGVGLEGDALVLGNHRVGGVDAAWEIRDGREWGEVSDGERTAGVSIRGRRRFDRAARESSARRRVFDAPFPRTRRVRPEPPPIFLFQQRRAPCVAGVAHHGVVGAAHEVAGFAGTLRRKSSCRRRLGEGGVGAESDFRPECPFGFSRRLEAPPPRLLPPWHATWFSERIPYGHLVITHNLADPSRPRETSLGNLTFSPTGNPIQLAIC